MKKILEEITKHPLFRKEVNFGLSGTTFVDHVIGLVEESIDEQNRVINSLATKCPDLYFWMAEDVQQLDSFYGQLKEEYPLHFKTKTEYEVNTEPFPLFECFKPKC